MSILSPALSATTPQQTGTAAEFKHTTVLIIDDDSVYRMLLRDMCHKLGIGHIAEAPDGAQGLAAVEIVKPDLILLDIMMPGLDGIEVCRRLRAMPTMTETAILIQTSVTDESKKLEGFNAGATDYISKPIQVAEFMARVRNHLRTALAARRLTDFRERIAGHLTIANQFLSALLPDPQSARELAARNGFALSVVQKHHEEIGGDLWYVHELEPGKLLIILLDPNTPGLAGAINALRVDTVLRELWRSMRDPQQLLRELDRSMAASPCGRLFASVTAVVVDRSTDGLWYTASGNPYPIFCRNRNAATLISGGLPLGSGLATLELHHLTMQPNDILVLHSDGWPSKSTYNPIDLIQAAEKNGPLIAETLLDITQQTNDDTTIITLRRLG